MKLCPECRRNYYDDTLKFCLDDGAELLDGPVSADEPATAIFSGSTRSDGALADVSGHKRGRTFTAPIVIGIAVFCIAIISVIGFAIYRFKGKELSGALPAKKITRLTNGGRIGNATISPDGKYVVYSAIDETTRQSSLWLRHIVTSSVVQIVPPEGAGIGFGQAMFSRDSNYIYFIRTERNNPGALYQVPVLGGSPKKILDDVTRISFSPDGSRFAFERRDQTKGEDDVVIANADGSGEQTLSIRKHPEYYLPGLSWSPDGQTIACPFGGWEDGYYRSIIFIAASDGRDKSVPYHRWNNLDRVEWLSDGSGVLTTANDKPAEPFQIWMVSFPTGEARTITSDVSDYRNLSLTSDSTALVATLSDTTSNLWVTPLNQPNGGIQITNSKVNGLYGVAWTPGGKIVYASGDGGSADIWMIGADGRDKRQITNNGYGGRYLCVTPDGRNIVSDSYRSENIQLWKIGIDGSSGHVLTSGPGFGADCSHADHGVIYTTFGTGGFSVWKVSADGGEPVQLINKYALIPSISPDGKLIACYYVADVTRATKIGIFPIDGGEPIKQFDLLTTAGAGSPPVRWMPDGRSMAYIAMQGGVSNIWLQPMEGGLPKPLTDFKDGRVFWFDISRDGKQLAMSRGTQTSDVVLIKDFK